jgi:dTDP-4-dehydrorhamnose reductase
VDQRELRGPRRMKILLFGKNGQVGWELQRSLSPLGQVVALGSSIAQNPDDLCGDFSDLDGLAATIRQVKPNIVVNAAAYTAVDQAESEPELAYLVNSEAPKRIAQECELLGAWMLHFSTDYVFDGSGHIPWNEGDPACPLSVYGKSKLDGERAISAACARHVVLRTSWVYGARGQNFLKTIMRLAVERSKLSIISDQWGAPTGAELLADVAAQIIPQISANDKKSGVYHCAAAGSTTWHGYAQYLIETSMKLGKNFSTTLGAIEAIPTSSYKTAAQRPLNSRLNCEKIEQTFSLKRPPWQAGVARVIEEITK